MTTPREQVLDTAKQYVISDRNTTYDDPEKNFERIADLWDVALENALERGYFLPHEVGIAMMCVKIARMTTSPGLLDNYADLAGYAACAYEAYDEDAEG